MRAFLVGTLLFLAAMPAAADTTTPATSGEPATATKPDPSEIICIDMPPPAGSRISPGRECHTRLEWATMRQQGIDTVRMYDRNMPTSGPPKGAAGGMGH